MLRKVHYFNLKNHNNTIQDVPLSSFESVQVKHCLEHTFLKLFQSELTHTKQVQTVWADVKIPYYLYSESGMLICLTTDIRQSPVYVRPIHDKQDEPVKNVTSWV